MSKEISIYTKALGMNPAKRPQELSWNTNGEVELAECKNVFIDKYGLLWRRLGLKERVSVQNVHTLYDNQRSFVGVGAVLYELVGESLLVVKSNCSGQPIKMAVYGGKAYCYDGVSYFVVKADRTTVPWVPSAKVGAKTTRSIEGPVPFTKAVSWFGRIFILHTQGVIFFTDPLGPVYFDYANNFLMDGNKIIDFAAAKGVMVVGTEKTVFLLVGQDLDSTQRVPLCNKSVIKNSCCAGFLDGKEVVCFTTVEGMYAATGAGEVKKVSEEKLPYDFFNGFEAIGATLADERYTVYGSVTDYTVDLKTGAIESHSKQYSAVSGLLAWDGQAVGEIECSQSAGVEESVVTFPMLSFGSSKFKGVRYVYASGTFNEESTWAVKDSKGNISEKVIPGSEDDRQLKIPVSSVVSGPYVQISFKTSGPFVIDAISILPIVQVTRGQ